MVADEWREFVQRFRHGAHQDYAEHWQVFRDLAIPLPESAGPMPVWWPGERDQQESNLAQLLPG